MSISQWSIITHVNEMRFMFMLLYPLCTQLQPNALDNYHVSLLTWDFTCEVTQDTRTTIKYFDIFKFFKHHLFRASCPADINAFIEATMFIILKLHAP